jgi:hypothetical protein
MNDVYQSPEFKQSLNETMVWCSNLVVTVLEQSPALNKYFEVMKHWGQVMQPAPIWKRWFRRKITGSQEWEGTSELIRLTSPFVASMTSRFRSSHLPGPSDTEALKTDDDWQEAVRSVSQKRHQLLQGHEITPATDEHNGRLLLCWPAETVADGAAQYASAGMFDVNDVPPWDMWVHFSRGTLISCVPNHLVGLAQAGIDSNPVDCIRWA